MSNFPAIVAVVKLPDGRWAAENGDGVGDLNPGDLQEILEAFKLWWEVQWDLKS